MTTTNTLDTNKSSIMNLFKFEGQEVRVLDVNGAPWWVLADVCGVLEISQPHHAANRLDEDEKDRAIVTTLGGPQEMAIINESGLWSLVLTSRKAAAKRFKKWVTAEVIPSIRKTGGYSAKPLVPQTYAEALLEAGLIAKERDALKAENRELAPKAEALEELASLDGRHNIRSAAQQCGWPERKFANKLCELKWCYRHAVTGRLTVYRETINRGFMDAKNVEVKRTGYVEGVGQPMLTQNGLAKIRTIIGTHEVAKRPFAKAKEPAPA
ncbi:phage antirepressor [Komagataeibacter diospyri]|uniref:Phage associated-antirepressor BRO n=1 Tax=Komagataeibacter diospyri TaxID=1932662 RepID=A0A4P5NTQ4_9PROT|nr:BRO family protein [Komagataeibacter diospyri]GCE85168.1 phage associated-antirepressor BRO [Komagataeibacter diospyri]